ncbi:hypothetical protein [Xanthomonas maliensis]|uniref:hypothetical protein n=1 Tax=Xanthomonas maliensis TaxID=1321368 RepID=UPI0003A1D2CD|nr:hypothetical protein [Xanthomonas maliensis]KAB7769184.1 hypothetical protein CKY51_07630 [Xanthomonas maliensis]
MRRMTVCLLLSLAPLAALAADRVVDGDREGCISTNSAAHGRTPGEDSAAPPRAAAHKPTPTTATGGGGGDSDALMPRMRMMPRWHSLLPGMFR